MTNGEEKWFALRVKPQHEKVVSTMLASTGYQSFLPVYKHRSQRRGHREELELPLFPGYVFCSFDPLHRLPIVMIPGVVHVVSFGRAPVPIDDLEINSLRTVTELNLRADPHEFLQAGQRVRIVKGALAGVEGILLDRKKSFRLVMSITLLERSVMVEIDEDWVEVCLPIPGPVLHANLAVKEYQTFCGSLPPRAWSNQRAEAGGSYSRPSR